MAKLSQMIDEAAYWTSIPKATVNLVARRLREAELIASGGRGPGGAEMGYSDAANLIMALAGADQVKDAALVAQMMRDAVPISLARQDGEELPGGPTPLIFDGRDAAVLPFGEMLDGLLREMAEGDFHDQESGEPYRSIRLIVPRAPGLINAAPSLEIESDNKWWRFNYHANNPAFDAIPRDQWNDRARELFGSAFPIGFSHIVQIHDLVLSGMAHLIAGKSLREDEV